MMAPRRLAAALAGALLLSTATAVALASGVGGLLYAVIYLLTLTPGLPLGFLLFGRRHAAGWVVGAATGYFLTTLALWAAIDAHAATVLGFAAAWGVSIAVTWLAAGRGGPLLETPAWKASDTAALLLTLLLVPAIAGVPFARVGSIDHDGNRQYRAYFTADFVWHMAVTAELKKFTMPPRNPFMPHRPLPYYWAYFVVPAAISGAGPAVLANVEDNLKVNAIGTAMLFAAAIFIFAWSAIPRAMPVAAGVALAIVASSAEGFYAIARHVHRHLPISALRDENIDAISNWWFGGLRVDGLPRCFWWVPQHSTSYILGLAGLTVLVAAGPSASAIVALIGGVVLGGAVAFNPFVGALFCLTWGLTLVSGLVRSPGGWRHLPRAAPAALPVVLALLWCLGNQMVGRAPSLLEFGLRGDAAHSPLWNLALSLGPILGAGLVGLWAARRVPDARITAAVVLGLVSLVVMHLVRLGVDVSWVGFRAGQILIAAMPALVAAGLAATEPLRRIARGTAVIALVIGLPTTLVDVYNAQDVENRNPGPGFPWTEVIDAPHRDAFAWLRQSTPVTATVQLDIVSRGRTLFTVIPSFAERRMSAAEPATLVDDPEYHERSERVRALYTADDAQAAWKIARGLRIDYLYVDQVERAAYPAGVQKFASAPELFTPVFQNDAVTVYRVR